MMAKSLVDQTPQRCCALLQAVWAKLGSKRLRWERRRALCSAYALASLRQRLAALFYGVKQPIPLFASDSSSARAQCSRRPPTLARSDHPSSKGKRRLHGMLSLLAPRQPSIFDPIRRSLRRKRRSNGGECSPITSVITGLQGQSGNRWVKLQ